MQENILGDNKLNNQEQTRGGAAVAHWTHNPGVGGSIPPPATNNNGLPSNIVLGYN